MEPKVPAFSRLSANSRASSRSSPSIRALRLKRILFPAGSTSTTWTSTSLPTGNAFLRSVPRCVLLSPAGIRPVRPGARKMKTP